VSRERAVGLTQLLPSTGSEVSRKLGLPFARAHLYQPEANLRLGARHLRDMIDSLQGDTVAALAAYNAGKSRPDAWLNWAEFREPAEFIETIPFTETRDYVQAVLRNADMYRRLYAGSPAALTSSGGSSSRGKTAGGADSGGRSGVVRKGAVP
jgi:soluble lytic murein transglycosylase